MWWQDLLRNRVLSAVAVAWFIAQTSKPLLFRITKGRWDWRWLFSAGGMPSSHSAAVAALATAVALREGLHTAAFAIAIVLAVVVMYDSAGVRRASSLQARILNQILEELFSGRPIAHTKLIELVGHTPFEVIVGGALGTGIVLWMAR